MIGSNPRSGHLLLLAGALALAACGGKDNTAGDPALNPDLAMPAPGNGQVALNDAPVSAPAPAAPAPVAVAPRREAPRREPARAPERRPQSGIVNAGTTIFLAAGERVCTNTHQTGSQFMATVSEPVAGTNGVTIPAGSVGTFDVTGSKRSENINDKAILVFNLRSITIGGTAYPVQSTVASAATEKGERSGKDVQKVATGTAIGALAGQILGKNTKSTIIGGAIGAAAGTAVAATTGNTELCVPEAGRVAVTLDAPLTIPVGS